LNNNYPLSFSPDGKLLATPGIDEHNNTTVQLRDVSGKLINDFKIDDIVFDKMSFSTDSEQIIFVSGDIVQLWNLSGKKLGEFKVPKNEGIMDINVNTTGTVIATTSSNKEDKDYGTVWLRKLSGEEFTKFKPYQGLVKTLAFSPNGKIVATSGIDSTIKLWNLNGRQVGEFKLGQNNSK